MTLSGTESGVEALSDRRTYPTMNHIRHGPGPPIYHPQHGSGGFGHIDQGTSSTSQRQHYPDVKQNPIVTYGVERQSDAGFNGTIGDGTKADRVCGLRPSCLTPMQPHRRLSATPSSFQHGTNFMGSRGPTGMSQYGGGDEGAVYTAGQSFPPSRELPRGSGGRAS